MPDTPLNLGFEEAVAVFDSPSQNARVWTEQWVQSWLFCPNCGAQNIRRFERNRPVADFHCETCAEEYELKSQKGRFGRKVLDGAYAAMIRRLAASNNPSLILMNYDLARLSVTNLFFVPRHFFVREVIEERKPLALTARRAGWIGCNILLGEIPESGKIFYVRDGEPLPRAHVLEQWKATLFLKDQGVAARGWLIEVMKCVEAIGRSAFTLDDVYAFEDKLARVYPGNNNVRPKIRQQLQVLRDQGYLDFVGRGRYRLRFAG
ncbi:MAG: DpnI domain-containing protein [Caulobacteraceae bacterium]|nr:DpnI domain-containing protein [Caulobacteraceae bacterium]